MFDYDPDEFAYSNSSPTNNGSSSSSGNRYGSVQDYLEQHPSILRWILLAPIVTVLTIG